MSAGTGPLQKRVSICADDFGVSTAGSRGIAELAGSGRLSAVSCLTTGEPWLECAPMLADLPAAVERGLHFNLTEGEPLSAELRRHWPHLPRLSRLVALAHLGRLPRSAIEQEWQAQLQRFTDRVGAMPCFIDGHQHVHHLPGVRDVVLAAVVKASGAVAVRNTGCVLGPGHAFKRRLIECTGGRALQRQLRAQGIRCNRVLLGAYDFRDPDYRGCMQRWLAAAPVQGSLLFCHPAAQGVAGPDLSDPIGDARRREGEYLASAAFVEDLAAAGVDLGPTWA
ncbi:MAG TPA: ChbG/HpnK family deacetylase [Roseateles sp.]